MKKIIECVIWLGTSLRYEGREDGSNAGTIGEPPNNAALLERGWKTVPTWICHEDELESEAKRIAKDRGCMVTNAHIVGSIGEDRSGWWTKEKKRKKLKISWLNV